MNKNSLADHLPYWHLEENYMVYKDGSLGAGFKIFGKDISSASNEVINTFVDKIERLFLSMDEDFKIQFFYRLTPNVLTLIQDHKNVSADQTDAYKEISSVRFQELDEKAKEQRFYHPEFHIFVRTKSRTINRRKFWQKKESFRKLSLIDFNESIQLFEKEIQKIENHLQEAGLSPILISGDDLFKLVFEYLNLDRSENVGCPKRQTGVDSVIPSFSSQVALTDILVANDYLKIGKYYFRTLSLKTLPEGQTFASMSDPLTKVPFHYWMSCNVQLHNQKKEIDRLQIQRRLAHSWASGSNNLSDLESESKLAQIEDLGRELIDGSEKLVSMSMTAIIYAETKEELDQKGDSLLKIFRQVGNAEAILETLPNFEILLKNAPGICEGTRLKKMKSSNAADLIPLFDYWRGNRKPVCLIPNRDSVLFSIDPFAKELPNWNGLIFGGSGAGKSFTICQLMLQFCGQSPTPKIVWIDNGASSERLLEVLGGEFIDLNLSSGIRLNMFDLPEGA